MIKLTDVIIYYRAVKVPLQNHMYAQQNVGDANVNTFSRMTDQRFQHFPPT